MTTAQATGRRVSAIVTYTLRSCVGPKRWIGCLLPCGGALLFGLLARANDQPVQEAFARVAANGIFALVVPIAALVIGDAVLGAEVRSGVFHFTWLSPAPLAQIAIGRWAGGMIVATVTIVPACALAALIAGDADAAGAIALAAFFGAAAYIAIFITFGCIAKRAAVWSLAFVFFVERLLGAALTGIAQLSPTWESRAIFVAWIDDAPSRLVRDGIPQGGAAIFRLALVTIVALALAIWRMRHMRMVGASD